jgi:hypothetical protein
MIDSIDVGLFEDSIDYCDFNIGVGDDKTPFLICRFKDTPFDMIIFEIVNFKINSDDITYDVTIYANPDNVEIADGFRLKTDELVNDMMKAWLNDK